MSLKQLKEQFVSDLTGGSIGEIYSVTAIALAGYLSHSIVQKAPIELNGITLFVVQFFFDVLLILQAITISSNRIASLYAYALIPGFLALLWTSISNLKKGKRDKPKDKKDKPKDGVLLGKKAFITGYRAQMMVITNLAILAVDFHAFPRRFGKVETWGTSLMDLGVGLFVFSMGLANSRAVIRKKTASEKVSYMALVAASTMKALPVLVLGVIRLVSVKSLEYQEHESEYGVHWNFFMTLGLLPIFLGLLDPVFLVPRFFVALALAVLYEYFLQSGLQAFILDPSNRHDSLLTLNKEGIFSFVGYLSIFIFGQSFGLFVLTSRKTPNNLLGTYTNKPLLWLTVSTTRGLCIMTVVTLSLFYIAKESFLTGNISRRLANLPYVLWVVSYNAAFLLGYDLIEQLVGPCDLGILNAINKNGLPIFLLANLTTGLVNMTINTLETSVPVTYVILIIYALLWTFVAMVLDKRGIFIKL